MANRRFRSLTRRKDFLELRSEGISFHVNSWLLVNANQSEHGVVRCGWTLPRQIGSAVLRNRFRRWGREFLRAWAERNDLSLDFNLVFKRKEKDFYKSVSHKEFDGAMEKLVDRLARTFNK